MTLKHVKPLPPVPVLRWTPGRKAGVVEAWIRAELTAHEICRRYRLAPEELERWRTLYEKGGILALRVTYR